MASSYGFTFDNISRIGNDNCGINARDVQNNTYGSYLTTNHFIGWCDMKTPMDFALQQPNVFYKGGHGGAGGCNIDSDSDLKIGTTQTNPKCRISLQQRPFSTVPYLGRGPPRPVLESRLMQGSTINDIKTCKKITEQTFNCMTPLIPSIQQTIQNPEYLVESAASEGWIRGGLPSRELSRTRNATSQ
tara:strand:- start:859 stop:1422 length:564 start_codon:yes stop_codon:yes gene_type:complete